MRFKKQQQQQQQQHEKKQLLRKQHKPQQLQQPGDEEMRKRQEDEEAQKLSNPFRPWDVEEGKENDSKDRIASLMGGMFGPAALQTLSALLKPMAAVNPGGGVLPIFPQTYTPPPEQEEPLSLVKHERREEEEEEEIPKPIIVTPSRPPPVNHQSDELAVHHLMARVGQSNRERAEAAAREFEGASSGAGSSKKTKQRNYKNMTRERRVEANARERQRVHTITAAFDTLQSSIPSDNSGQKLSKLSIIKIATSYIMVLSRMAGYDYSIDESKPSVEECVKKCKDLIDSETKVKKKCSSSPGSE